MNKKEVYFSVGEKEMIEILRDEYKVTYLEACDYVIGQKRELAWMHSRDGKFDLAEQILTEICEWNTELEAEFIRMGRGTVDKDVKIITEW